MPSSARLALRSARGRLVVAATVLGSGVVFLETTVVNVAMPAIAKDLDLNMAGLQWVLDGYLLTLSALILTGGTLGDVIGRGRVFVLGLFAFAATSALAAFMPTVTWLVVMRLLQGAAGALLVPNSLAVLETFFEGKDRSTAIGQWAGWSAGSTALGPVAGGWIVDELSWRWAFGIVAPIALLGAVLGARVFPHSTPEKSRRTGGLDPIGALLATLSLAGITTALIVGPVRSWSDALVLACGIGGIVLLFAFILHEQRTDSPMLPLSMFRVREFVGANLATFPIYGALAGVIFLLMLYLQEVLGYSALKAGAAFLPLNVLMVLLSPVAARLAARLGAGWLVGAGAAFCAGSALLFTRLHEQAGYFTAVLPATSLFGLGLATLVAPLTSAMMASADEHLKGVASAFNNAVSRMAGLLATAGIPLIAGIAGHASVQSVGAGFAISMAVCAGLYLAGAVAAILFMRRAEVKKAA